VKSKNQTQQRMEDKEIKIQKKSGGLAFSITSILSETGQSKNDCEEYLKENGKTFESHSNMSDDDEEEQCLPGQENKEEEMDDDRDEEGYSNSNCGDSEHELETDNESDQGLEEKNMSKESPSAKTTKSNGNTP